MLIFNGTAKFSDFKDKEEVFQKNKSDEKRTFMKKKRTNRIFAILMALGLVFATACSQNDSSSSSEPDTSGNLMDNIKDDSSDTEQMTGEEYYSQPFENPETDAQVKVEGTDFTVNGKKIWFNAANTPWDQWNDFGGNFNEAFWDQHFEQLSEAGVNSTRIWINCNGLVGVLVNEDGSFDSVTAKHWQDLDKLFELAAKHKIYIMATLLSFDHFKNENTAYQNWRNMITSSDNIDQFVEGYVIPFVERYDDNDYLMSIDLMNEPDWVYENEESGKIPWEDLSNYFARAAAGIHEHSDVLVTVGFGMIKYNSDAKNINAGSDEYLQSLSENENSYLDFYSTHYYFWQSPWYGQPYTQSPESFGLDGTKPCVIGECAVVDESGMSIQERYESSYENGWDGVYAWTSNGVDNCGGFTELLPAVTSMYEKIPELIRPLDN